MQPLKPITTLIVDDEQDSRETLRAYISRYCPQLQIVGECINIEEARAALLKEKPQLVFLDIEMPHGNAFDLLEQLADIDFEVVFVTAFSQYAVQAFNLSAAHYLLKPVDIEALEKAVATVGKSLAQKEKLSHASVLLENMTALHSQNRKLVLPLLQGFEVVKMSEILYCEAEDNFTRFYFADGRKTLICRNLRFYETVLDDFGFFRVHRSYLINLDYVKRYLRSNGSVVLENGKEILVSTSRRVQLVERIKGV